MSKFFKSRFSAGQNSENPSKIKINLEFFQVLKEQLSKPASKLYLNIPETIIMNPPDKIPYLLYTDTDGSLNFKDNITSE